MKKAFVAVCLGLLIASAGCGSKTERPKFTLAWSEYPSWSVFGVADEKGLINGKEGELGPIERKYGIDIVLKQADYDVCITMFGNNTADASCQTNVDSLAPALGRNSVIIMPTSTSVGADACIVVGKSDNALKYLKGVPTYGLEKSCSQFAFERNLQLLDKNVNLADYPFRNMDPAAAATAMQTRQQNINSIMVWNPFVLQTLRTRQDSSRLFDSAAIPEEIIDCIVIGKDVLEREGGEQFALAVIETYYEVCKLLADPKQADATYVALGAKFCKLNAADMKIVCNETRFYNTPDKALALMESAKFQNNTMPMITEWCLQHQMFKNDVRPTVGFNKANTQLNFDTQYLRKFQK